jgi:hypothetical protein
VIQDIDWHYSPIPEKKIQFDTRDQRTALYHYTSHSKLLNEYLLHPGTTNRDQQTTLDRRIQHIDSTIRANKWPYKHSLVYSGIGFDPQPLFSKKQKKLKLKAYTSSTHEGYLANKYARGHQKLKIADNYHILAIHLQHGDPAIHISDFSSYPKELETLVGRDITIKHLHTETYNQLGPTDLPCKTHIHHVKIIDPGKHYK